MCLANNLTLHESPPRQVSQTSKLSPGIRSNLSRRNSLPPLLKCTEKLQLDVLVRKMLYGAILTDEP